jgi:hypothetical protein
VDPDPGIEMAAIALENGHVNIFKNVLHSGPRQNPQANFEIFRSYRRIIISKGKISSVSFRNTDSAQFVPVQIQN